MTTYEIALLPGDGIGPEVVDAAVEVLTAAADLSGLQLNFTTHAAGAAHYRETGVSISPEVTAAVGKADAVLLGAMGLPDIRKEDGTEITPQIDLREHYDLFASLRPCILLPGVPTRVRADKIDMLVIRETTEGLFAGRHDEGTVSADAASDRLTVTREGCIRLFDIAFEQARVRRDNHGTPGHVTLLDKSNVLRSNAFMRSIFDEVAAKYPDIGTDRLYIDAGSMMLVTNPERFDVVVSENVFGDITSEIAAGVVGGLGVAPSGDVSREHGIFQPSHGSAPDIAGSGVANPVATMLSAAMLLEWLGGRNSDDVALTTAGAIRSALAVTLEQGVLTRDLGGSANTAEVTASVVSALKSAVTTAV
ncbi:3-isopropylmalate dehydrogenase [Rhodococcus sp. 06-621-2]|nr:isocitrate/isopropylmalate dehydrogenase family protein [Rhodococcus sp. 06-621-2]OZC55533.1 3-isopropylmalate dehydrogenase [Rhodococcus sp. 06-621-2]